MERYNRYITFSLIRPEENTIYSDKPSYLEELLGEVDSI